MAIRWWGDLSDSQRNAFIWHNETYSGGSGIRGGSGQTNLDDRAYTDREINEIQGMHNDYLTKQAEIERARAETERARAEAERLQKETELTEETTRQQEDKNRKAEMLSIAQNNSSSNTGKNMLSAGTGFAKLRRKVLGSLGDLGSTDKKLGG